MRRASLMAIGLVFCAVTAQAADPLGEARRLYNAGQYEAAAQAAKRCVGNAGHGSKKHPVGDFDAANVVDILERDKVTGCYFVPTQWQQICEVPGVKDRDLSLKRMLWGASVAATLGGLVPALGRAATTITEGGAVSTLTGRVAAFGGATGLLYAAIVLLMVYRPGG